MQSHSSQRRLLSWGPAVDQLYQMPQMARHCGGLPREDWNSQIHWKYFYIFKVFRVCTSCEEKFTSDLLSTIKLPKNAIEKSPVKVLMCRNAWQSHSWTALPCNLQILSPTKMFGNGYFALRSLPGNQGFKWLLAKTPLSSGFAGPFWPFWQLHSWVVKHGWTAHTQRRITYVWFMYNNDSNNNQQ